MDMLKKFAELLGKSQRIACLTGAGMSTESGIPDYRSTDGLYNTLTSEEVFDIVRFRHNPAEFYHVIGPLYCSIVEAKPNSGHLALEELESRLGKRVDVATQNIDGLHQKAGSRHVYEVHGTMNTLSCPKCGCQVSNKDYLPLFKKGETVFCKCGHVLKPDITFYGESLPEDAFSSSIDAFSRADLVLVLGTSLAVYPAAMLPSYRKSSAKLVIINRTPTQADDEAELVFNDSIGKVLPAALAML